MRVVADRGRPTLGVDALPVTRSSVVDAADGVSRYDVIVPI